MECAGRADSRHVDGDVQFIANEPDHAPETVDLLRARRADDRAELERDAVVACLADCHFGVPAGLRDDPRYAAVRNVVRRE